MQAGRRQHNRSQSFPASKTVGNFARFLGFDHVFNRLYRYDIRSNTLGLLYASLELDYEFIRAVTPFYSVYDIVPRSAAGLKHIENDASFVAKEIRRLGRKKAGNTGYYVSAL